ncbi:hypothetical protein GCM10009682_06030 [Luedemannella flava]|uniref:PKD domain-containing protein n=1 Tax=Luedemannella flava TaxID=349316 RepID=A0ABN2LFM4_9ACTN
MAAPAHAATTQVYVDNNPAKCSDSGAGTATQPFCTIAAGLAAVGPGMQLNIYGQFAEHLTIAKSGTPEQPITIYANGGVLTGANAGLTIDGQHDIVVRNLAINGSSAATGAAVALTNSTRITLDSTTVVGTVWAYGYRLTGVTDSSLLRVSAYAGGTGIAVDSTSARDIIEPWLLSSTQAGSAAGVSVLGSQITVRNTYAIRTFYGAQIDVGPGATDTVVVNNRIPDAKRGVGIRVKDATGTVITNNTVAGCLAAIRVEGNATGTSVQNNVVRAPASGGCDPAEADAEIGVYGAAVGSTTVDYNSLAKVFTRPYAWGTFIRTLADFQAASGQGAHDRTFTTTDDPAVVDSANSAAPGAPDTDANGATRVDNEYIANSGAGPIDYADRGAEEYTQVPTARLTVTTRRADLQVTADASASTLAGAPATYEFTFGDGTTVTQSTPVATHTYARGGIWNVTVKVAGVSTAQASASFLNGVYQPVDVGTARVLDTRSKIGVTTTTPLAARQTLTLPILGRNGVPAADVHSVALNVTVLSGTAAGSLTVYGGGTSGAPNIHWVAGRVVANLVTVPVTDGKVVFTNNSSGTVHVVADLAGYYTYNAGSLFTATNPVRVLNTATKTGVSTTTPIAPKGTLTFQLAGVGGVPASDVAAVVLNVTAFAGTSTGSLNITPNGKPLLPVNALSWVAGASTPNLVIVPMTNGKINFYNGSTGTVHVVADVFGYFSASSNNVFVTEQPTSVLNTTVAGKATVAANVSGVLRDEYAVRAVVLNTTVSAGASDGWLTVHPNDAAVPGTSNLNWVTGETVGNSIIVRTGNRIVNFVNGSSGKVTVRADAVGYFVNGV